MTWDGGWHRQPERHQFRSATLTPSRFPVGRGFISKSFGCLIADEAMSFRSHLRCCRLTSTDSPHGFVSHDQRLGFHARDIVECDIALPREHFRGQSRLAFFEYLSNTDNRLE